MKQYKDNILNPNEYKKMKKEKYRKFKERKRNKNAQGQLLMILTVALAFFMFGILIVGLLFPDITIARSSDSLDCSNMTISSGNKLSCLGVDMVVPIFIISLVIIGGGAVVIKLVGG